MMKKFTLSLLAWCAVVAAFANPITRSEARLVAQELVQIDDATADTDELAPYYIFSRGAGKGFVIVSGPNMHPLCEGHRQGLRFLYWRKP